MAIRWRVIDAETGEILIQHLTRIAARAWHDDYTRAGRDVAMLPDKQNPNPYAPTENRDR
jgi:hypothetical protein